MAVSYTHLDVYKRQVYNLAFDEQNRPIEYSISRYRSEVIKFTNYMKC